jgi:hypothetical protein
MLSVSHSRQSIVSAGSCQFDPRVNSMVNNRLALFFCFEGVTRRSGATSLAASAGTVTSLGPRRANLDRERALTGTLLRIGVSLLLKTAGKSLKPGSQGQELIPAADIVS